MRKEPYNPREAKDRKCLCCGVSFRSKHAGHRVCSKCKTNSRQSSDFSYGVYTMGNKHA